MRALLDANVYVSALLVRDGETPPPLVVQAGLDGAYELLVSDGILVELRSRTASKPYLAARIRLADVELLVSLLGSVAELVPEIPPPFPAIGRDRKDDYLIAHALIDQADYLVSGDADLTSLGQIDTLRIVSPAEFLAILGDSGNLHDVMSHRP